MPTPSSKKKPSKKVAEDPLSSSGVSSLSGISAYNIRKISIYKNGDRFHRGVKFVINPRVVKDMEPLLNQINDRIELSHGAKKLYTTEGKVVSSIKELEDGKIYVAASAQFIPMRYGEFAERVWKPPSRKHSPIMSSDRIKTARTRSQEPGKRRPEKGSSAAVVQRSRSVRTLTEDRKSKIGELPSKTNGTISQAHQKKTEIPRPKAPANRSTAPSKKPVTTTKKPPTPKRRQPQVGIKNKKVVGAAMGAGVAVVGAAALGAAAVRKTATPKTAVSDISTASSVIPAPNIESNAAEILEFPEEEKKVDVATIHRTPTPSKSAASRSASAKSVKSTIIRTAAESPILSQRVSEAKSVSQQHSLESNEGSEEEEEDEEESEEEDAASGEEEDAESEEVEEPSDEEEEEEEEEEEDDESGVGTPASRRSSNASSVKSKPDEKDAKKE